MRAAFINSNVTELSDDVRGFSGEDRFESSTGADLSAGLGGADTYVFGRGAGNDQIDEGNHDAAIDRVLFTDFVSTEASAVRLFKGSDTVVIQFATSDDTLTVEDALSSDNSGIEEYEFSDGVIWSKTDLLAATENTAPVAQDDGFFSAVSGEDRLILAADILENDFDPDGNPVQLIAVDGGANGIAEINEDGNIVFRASEDFTGPTQISYTISDGQNGLSSAQIELRVRPVAEARDDLDFEVEEDGFLVIETERLFVKRRRWRSDDRWASV